MFKAEIECGNCGQTLETSIDFERSKGSKIVITVNDHECFHETEKKASVASATDPVNDNTKGWKTVGCFGCAQENTNRYEAPCCFCDGESWSKRVCR
jgi:hypothetical protein